MLSTDYIPAEPDFDLLFPRSTPDPPPPVVHVLPTTQPIELQPLPATSLLVDPAAVSFAPPAVSFSTFNTELPVIAEKTVFGSDLASKAPPPTRKSIELVARITGRKSAELPRKSIELPTRKSIDMKRPVDFAGPEPVEKRRNSLSERAAIDPTKRKNVNQDFGLGDKEWHLMSEAELMKELKTRIEGLSTAEHTDRLSEYGPNRITPPKVQHWFVKFLLTLVGEDWEDIVFFFSAAGKHF